MKDNMKLNNSLENWGILFKGINTLFWKHKMNPIVNKLLLSGDKFMPETHLK